MAVILVAYFFRADGEVQVGAPHLVRNGGSFRVLTPPEDIHPTVDVHTGYNAHLDKIMIEFIVGNLSTSSNAIWKFGIRNLSRPYAVRSPAQWTALYGVSGGDSALVWGCTDTLTAPPSGWSGRTSYPSPYMIDPGDTLHHFQVFTSDPPALITFYAWGFDTIPGAGATWTDPFTTGWFGQVGVTGVGTSPVPKMIELEAPRPNPSVGSTAVGFELPKAADVQLVVFDVRGARVRTLASGRSEAGNHVVSWDGYSDAGKACSPGAYFARLVVDGKEIGARRIVILR